jgi:predicted nucleic acid-binding protein
VIVLDASAAIELLLRTPTGNRVERLIFSTGESLHAPHLIDLEVAQVLRRYTIADRIRSARGTEALQDLADMSLIRHHHTSFLPRVWQLRENLTAYDAVYVALAELLEARLLTCDGRMTRAGNHRARIELIPMPGN